MQEGATKPPAPTRPTSLDPARTTQTMKTPSLLLTLAALGLLALPNARAIDPSMPIHGDQFEQKDQRA